MAKVFAFHKATTGLDHFVDTVTLKLEKQTNAETNPHPDFFVEGRDIAALLYDYLPGSTVTSVLHHLEDLRTKRTPHDVASSQVLNG